jgi:cell division protein FtsI/penicillin-binding protein 2
MQRAAEDAFRATGHWGSAVILDPNNGDVLTLTSLPAYDPNAFSTGIDRGAWAALNTDKLRPLQNRAIQGRYSPGSTFKIVVATAALEEGVITPEHQIYCPGGATFYGRFFKCHLAGGHGYVDLRHAIEKSCNTYFYTVGNMLGVDRMHTWAEKLGLAGKSGVDLAERDREHHSLDGVETAARPGAQPARVGREVVRRRDDLGRDWTRAVVGYAHVAGCDDGNGGQRGPAGHAASREGRRTRDAGGAR